MKISIACAALIASVFSFNQSSLADTIVPSDIVFISQTFGSDGQGILDLELFNSQNGGTSNASGAFNGDNANNTLPKGGGASDGDFFAESYVTTAGEIQQFLILNFPNGNGGSTVSELLLLLDLNESGPGAAINNLDLLEIVLNPTLINTNPDPASDLTGAQQAAINQIYTGGTMLAELESSVNVPIMAQGTGNADYAILTGINPFLLDPNDVVLFNFSMSSLSSGGEELFLSGTFSVNNIVVPEPFSGLVLAFASGLALFRRNRND